MDLILSHTNLDFDGLAAMVAASKIYPQAQPVVVGKPGHSVQQFLALYKDYFSIKTPGEIPDTGADRVILVDTGDPRRTGEMASRVSGAREIHIYDHHPVDYPPPRATKVVTASVGATSTLMVEILRQKDVEIHSFEATVLALGIYADTGSLTYSATTSRDALAVAYLLEQGANLSVVANFLDRRLTEEQQKLLNRLIASVKQFSFRGIQVLVATAEADNYVEGLSLLTEKLLEVLNADTVFTLVSMAGRTYLVGRTRLDCVPVDEIVAYFGGGGHRKAGAASLKGQPLEAVMARLPSVLSSKIRPLFTARQIMSQPVKTVTPETLIQDAGKVMLRYGHSGLPVVENGVVVGIISRRDVDLAERHGLGHAPVKGYMKRKVVTISPDTTLPEIQQLMVRHDVGRLPVVENGQLIGIVSRTDLLRWLHGTDDFKRFETLFPIQCSLPGPPDVKSLLLNLPGNIYRLLRQIGGQGDELEYSVFVVGGFVRDLLLGVPNCDLDIVVEGDGIKFAERLAGKLGGYTRPHEQFKTALVILPDGLKIDVATARIEYYEYPAALPTVEVSSLKQDLYRRDFTINAMAVQLNLHSFGKLIDYFCCYSDLKEGLVRVLHNFSFVEDPTRIIRALRFEQRYGFSIEEQTLALLQKAVRERRLAQLSDARLWDELFLVLKEDEPARVLCRMGELGIWDQIVPQIQWDENTEKVVLNVESLLKELEQKGLPHVERWLVYFMALVHKLEEVQVEELGKRFSLRKKEINVLRKVLEAPEVLKSLPASEPTLGRLHKLLHEFPAEAILFAAASFTGKLRELLLDYLARRDRVELVVDGLDLRQLGLPPGPLYGEIFLELEAALLEGKAGRKKEEQINFVQEWLRRKGRV